jgi:hypothetical protein
MKEHMVRLSFDIPEEEHILLKTGCAQLKIAIKDFLYEMTLKGLRELKEKQVQDRLKKSIKQSKEGKLKSRGSFAKYVKDEI